MTEASDSNEWWYPDEDYRDLCDQFKIIPMIDVAANAKNSKCLVHFEDALDIGWNVKNQYTNRIMDLWMNPPLGKGMTEKFVRKAYNEWIRHGMGILSILPAGVISRKYFKQIWDSFKLGEDVDIEPIRPRPKFLLEGKKTKWSARNDYITVHFKRWCD